MERQSKAALDKIIKKSRVHLYKPIQTAEILYHFRNDEELDLSKLDTYRNASKRWRDEISQRLVGRASTSSQKFQDNLFDNNAMPPSLLIKLGEFNNKHDGLVEAYIYKRLEQRLSMVGKAFNYLKASDPNTFSLNDFVSRFVHNPGLKRSIDKVYEIIVYALFSTIVRALKVNISISIQNTNEAILVDFEDFVKLVLRLSKEEPSRTSAARLYRVGVTNAADRGLDMWANFGPAIQVKHISLSEELAEDVSDNISADSIILVCRDGEARVIERVTKQLPFSHRIQGIITFSNLKDWYRLCQSEKYSNVLGTQLLADLEREFTLEFPSSGEIAPFLEERGYHKNELTGKWALS